MSGYDPFNLPEPTAEERRQKHFLDSNGLWLSARYKDSFLNEKCLCGCIRARHLDGDSICLNQCLCEGFLNKKEMIVIPPKKGKLPSLQSCGCKKRTVKILLGNDVRVLRFL